MGEEARSFTALGSSRELCWCSFINLLKADAPHRVVKPPRKVQHRSSHFRHIFCTGAMPRCWQSKRLLHHALHVLSVEQGWNPYLNEKQGRRDERYACLRSCCCPRTTTPFLVFCGHPRHKTFHLWTCDAVRESTFQMYLHRLLKNKVAHLASAEIEKKRNTVTVFSLVCPCVPMRWFPAEAKISSLHINDPVTASTFAASACLE